MVSNFEETVDFLTGKQLPFFGLVNMQLKPEKADLILFGVPFDGTSSFRPGARFAPEMIRNLSSEDGLEAFSEQDVDIKEHYSILDLGNLIVYPGNTKKTFDRATELSKLVLSKKRLMGVLGGDHFVTIPVLSSLNSLEEEFSVIYLDAHLDLYQSLRGEKYSHGCVLRRLSELKHFSPEKSAVIGVRDFPKGQLEFAKELGLHTVPASSTSGRDLLEEGKKIAKRATQGSTKVYLSLDFDILDPAFAPGVSNPTPGGLSTRDLFDLIHGVCSRELVGFDLVEFNPPYDYASITGFAVVKTFVEILGSIISQRKAK